MKNIQAFPHFEKTIVNGDEITVRQTGMTLLDYFAGQALMVLKDMIVNYQEIAEVSYEVAEAMLKERENHEIPKK